MFDFYVAITIIIIIIIVILLTKTNDQQSCVMSSTAQTFSMLQMIHTHASWDFNEPSCVCNLYLMGLVSISYIAS